MLFDLLIQMFCKLMVTKMSKYYKYQDNFKTPVIEIHQILFSALMRKISSTIYYGFHSFPVVD